MNDKQILLRRIARYLMLHASSSRTIGLWEGKMSAVLFLYEYARHTGQHLYDDFAGELLDEVYDGINEKTPKDFDDGLYGIAWGMDYLIRNQYIEADPDEIFEELDKSVLEKDIKYIGDDGLEFGIQGIAYYVISRIGNRTRTNSLFTDRYLNDLHTTLKSREAVNNQLVFQADQLLRIIQGETIEHIDEPLKHTVMQIQYDSDALFTNPTPLGIKENGFSGIGLKLLWGEKNG